MIKYKQLKTSIKSQQIVQLGRKADTMDMEGKAREIAEAIWQIIDESGIMDLPITYSEKIKLVEMIKFELEKLQSYCY